MNQSFVHGPTRIVLGRGASLDLVDLLDVSWDRVAVLTSESGTGAKTVLDALWRSPSRNYVHVPTIRSNPDVVDLARALEVTRTVDAILAIGGGSVVDAGKALRVMSASDFSPSQWLDAVQVDHNAPALPLVAVPTTFGTGSEVSFGAIISDRARSLKRGLRGQRLAPDLAIVDPALMDGTPRHIAALAGFDTLTHAFESMVSAKSTLATRGLSWTAMRLVGHHLGRAIEGDPAAQEAVAFASTTMGMNLASVGTCMPHRLQYAVGGMHPQTAHPEVLAWLYPHWLRRMWSVARHDVITFIEALGQPTPESGDATVDAVLAWFEHVGVPHHPTIRPDPHVLVTKIEGDLSEDPLDDPHRQALEIFTEAFA